MGDCDVVGQCLCPNYRLQPVIGSTAPFRGCLKVMITATGHVTMSTRDRRMARTGTRMIPKRTHCKESGGGGANTQTHIMSNRPTPRKGGLLSELTAACLLTFLRAEMCTSLEIHITGRLSRKHTTALIVRATHSEALQADCQSLVGEDYGPWSHSSLCVCLCVYV